MASLLLVGVGDAEDRPFVVAPRQDLQTGRTSQDNFAKLGPEQQSALSRLVPLLRTADSLDRSHRHVVEPLAVCSTADRVTLSLEARGDAALAQWAAEQHRTVFSEAYGKELLFRLSMECE